MTTPRGLILCRAADTNLLQSVFPNQHLWLLPVAGKPIIEYQLETLSRLGIQEVRVLCDTGTSEIESKYGLGERLGLKLSYGPLPSQDNLNLVINRNEAFCSGHPLVLIQGLAVMTPLHAPHCLSVSQAVDLVADNSNTLILGLPANPEGKPWPLLNFKEPGQPQLEQLAWVESRNIDSLNDYYQENLTLLSRWRERISWPAYGSKNGFEIAERVSLGPELQLKGQGLIGGLSIVTEKVLLENSILGREVIIGAGSKIRNSIILDGSWIGPGLQLEHKIVDGNALIDPDTGTRIELNEPGWLDTLQEHPLASLSERVFACFLWLTLLPLYWLWGGANMQKYRLKHGELSLPSSSNALASRLQLHRVPRWQAVMRGQLALIGQEPLQNELLHPASIYPDYRPAALAFSEIRGSTGEQAQFDDASYSLFASPWQNICLCLVFLKSSLFKTPAFSQSFSWVIHEH